MLSSCTIEVGGTEGFCSGIDRESARQGRSCESVDGLNQLIHAHEKEFSSVSKTEKGIANHYVSV